MSTNTIYKKRKKELILTSSFEVAVMTPVKMTSARLDIWEQSSGETQGLKTTVRLSSILELRCWVMPWETAEIVHGTIWSVKRGRTKNELLKWIKDERWKSLGHLPWWHQFIGPAGLYPQKFGSQASDRLE